MNVSELLKENENKELLRFVTAGSVDDGKSTLIGRLLLDSKGIYEDQLAAVKQASGKKGSSLQELDLSLVTDGLKAEREQGITIDVAYRYFSTPKRKFIIADTPGHEQYTRNMATGASTAGLAVILVDASQGVLTQSKRHAFISSLLGIPHMAVAVNKMDLVDYSEKVFRKICADFTEFAAKLEVRDVTFIPVSALNGDNVTERSANTGWYQGPTLLSHLEEVHIAGDRNFIDMRFPVQYVSRGDPEFRGYSGTLVSGTMRPGDEVAILPAGTKSRITEIIGVNRALKEAFPPLAVTMTLADDLDVSRGDMVVHPNNRPRVSNRLEAMVVWMSADEMKLNKGYIIKHTTRTAPAAVTELRYKIDVETASRVPSETLRMNEIGRVTVTANRPLCFDPYSKNRSTGAFIIIDRISDNTVGAGMILDRIPDAQLHTGSKWKIHDEEIHLSRHKSRITPEERHAALGHQPCTVWLTGLPAAGKTTVAYELERMLFDKGLNAFVLDGENTRLGLSRDLDFTADDRSENIRRAAEAAKLMNDAGIVAICAFLSPYEKDRLAARKLIGAERFFEIHLAADIETCKKRSPGLYEKAEKGEIPHFSGISAPYEVPENPDLRIWTDSTDPAQSAEQIIQLLKRSNLA